jgi:hypothetical protein
MGWHRQDHTQLPCCHDLPGHIESIRAQSNSSSGSTPLESHLKVWWLILPETDQNFLMHNCSTHLLALKGQFLGEQWVQECTFEFKEMCFCQKGHEQELPTDFFQ